MNTQQRRPTFTREQRAIMDAFIEKYPTREEKENVARELGLDLTQVSNYIIRKRKETRERNEKQDVDVLENWIGVLMDLLQQAYYEISRLNNVTMGLQQENELQQANTVSLMNRILELENMLQPANDQVAGFHQPPSLF